MYGFRNRVASTSSLSPAAGTLQAWRAAEPDGPARPSRNGQVWRLSATFACLLGLPAVAHASFTFSAPNLAPGSNYRLIFVTSEETSASASDISTYNAFVNSVAGNDPSLPSTTWTAIASTESESAVANISSVCSGACLNAPVYLVDGSTVIATNQANFFSGTILNALDEDESGNTSGDSYVWTGSTSDGAIDGGSAMGDTGAEIGAGNFTDFGNYMDFGFSVSASDTLPLYAISGLLTVSNAVPEPMSGGLLLLGGAATGLVRRLRRKRPATV